MDTLSCRACGAAMHADSLDRRLAIVTCTHCGAIFDLTRGAGRAVTEAAPAEPSPRAPAALPDRFTVRREAGILEVRWRWFGPVGLFMLFFAIAWDAFLIFWYAAALSADAGAATALMLIFPIAHVAVGVGVTYYALANLLNTTTVRVDGSTLQVSHAPLPWRPAPRLRADAVEQIYVTRKTSQGKNGTSVSFQVRAVTREQQGVVLVSMLDALDQALWLEQEIEKQLGIRDRPVAGEYRPESDEG